MKTVYYFGNPDVPEDNIVFKVIPLLKKKFPTIKFKYLDPNQELSFETDSPIILDSAQGISKVELIKDLDKVKLTKSTTMHDFDLALNLKLLNKLGKIKSVKIIAVPNDLNQKAATDQAIKFIDRLLGTRSKIGNKRS